MNLTPWKQIESKSILKEVEMLKVPRKKMHIHEINFSIQETKNYKCFSFNIFKIMTLLNAIFSLMRKFL